MAQRLGRGLTLLFQMNPFIAASILCWYLRTFFLPIGSEVLADVTRYINTCWCVMICNFIGKGKVIPLQAPCGPEGG